MIMGSKHICSACGKHTETFYSHRQKSFMCAACQRLYNPPYMTLMQFDQGSIHRLWNLEVGCYEEFKDVAEIENCGWFVRSKQETMLSRVPRIYAFIYHMEYFGDIKCGRCVEYPYFDSDDHCLPTICKNSAQPFRCTKDIQYPPERSRYTKWMKISPC